MKGKSQTFPLQILPFISIFTICDGLQKGLLIIAIPITFLKCGEKQADLNSPTELLFSSLISNDFVRLISLASKCALNSFN